MSESRATMSESRATMSESRATMSESRPTMSESWATMSESRATLRKSPTSDPECPRHFTHLQEIDIGMSILTVRRGRNAVFRPACSIRCVRSPSR